MELITGILIGALLRHYLPNLRRSRAEDFKPPMAEYMSDEVKKRTKRWIL